jgi:hypothetical protein
MNREQAIFVGSGHAVPKISGTEKKSEKQMFNVSQYTMINSCEKYQ